MQPRRTDPYATTASGETDISDVANRDDRTVRTFGQDAVQQLHDASAAVVGIGGVGSNIAVQLARLGVNELRLIDPETVEASDLPRLAGATPDDIGRPKVAAVEERLTAINPAVHVYTVHDRVEDADSVLGGADVILAAVDQDAPRHFLNRYSVDHDAPYIDCGCDISVKDGSVSEMCGSVQTVIPGETACLDCLDRIDRVRVAEQMLDDDEGAGIQERGGFSGDTAEATPSVIHLDTVVASIAVDQFVKFVTSVGDVAGITRYEAIEGDMVSVGTSPISFCVICAPIQQNDG